MKETWKVYAARIDALSLRERLMVFGAALLVAVYLVFALFIDPARTRENQLVLQERQQQAELKILQQQIQVLEKSLSEPDAASRAQRADLQRQISNIDDSLKSMQHSLVPAQRMNALLQDMLTRNPRLQLVSMRTLPLATLVDKPAGATEVPPADRQQLAGEGNVFKHGVEVRLAGSYADLYDYLARLERLPARMFWSRAALDAEDYPRLTLTVTIYTLSLDKAWLEV